MTPEEAIKALEDYRAELAGIMARFVHGDRSYRIRREDDPRYRTIVIEVVDVIDDLLGNNKYSHLVYQLFQEGIANYLQTPSFKSIEDISSVIDSAITWLKRNKDTLKEKKEVVESTIEQAIPELKPPDKVTLKWIWEHTPSSYYWSVLVFLFAIFCLGIAFGKTNLYKSLMDEAIANISTSNMIPPASK
jgi:hypothetical protein